MTQRRKPGRPSLGDRHERLVRFPRHIAAEMARVARQEGVSVNEFIVETLAARLDIEHPGQGRLPLADAS